MSVGSTLTLSYPSGFFASAGSPTAAMDGGDTASVATPTASAIILTLTGSSSIAVNTAVIVTVSGLTMGAVTAGATGVSIRTSNDASSSPTQISSGHVLPSPSLLPLPPPTTTPFTTPHPRPLDFTPALFRHDLTCTPPPPPPFLQRSGTKSSAPPLQ